jgi:hypothetical protein
VWGAITLRRGTGLRNHLRGLEGALEGCFYTALVQKCDRYYQFNSGNPFLAQEQHSLTLGDQTSDSLGGRSSQGWMYVKPTSAAGIWRLIRTEPAVIESAHEGQSITTPGNRTAREGEPNEIAPANQPQVVSKTAEHRLVGESDAPSTNSRSLKVPTTS